MGFTLYRIIESNVQNAIALKEKKMFNSRELEEFAVKLAANQCEIIVKQFEDRSDITQTIVSISAGSLECSLTELGRILSTLLDERYAVWAATSEGMSAHEKSLATAMWLGATNPEFTLEAAMGQAKSQIEPFSAAIAILEQNGYAVTKKTLH